MNYFYAAATMGFDGRGYWWHRFFNFPTLPTVTKTITHYPKKGYPYAIIHLLDSTWNHTGLHNPGLFAWRALHHDPRLIVSLAGTDDEIQKMCYALEMDSLAGIELNYSCPNVTIVKNKRLPDTSHKLYLKLNYSQDPYRYNLDRIERISLNSISRWHGGVSGKLAQKENWGFIKKYRKQGLPIAGCSITRASDIHRLRDLGCTEIALGSVMLINPWLVQKIGERNV